MKHMTVIAMALLLSALFGFGGGVALAHGGKGVAVQPLTPKPGEVITVTGQGLSALGAKSQVEVRIIGTGVDIDLGEVEAGADADFTAQFRVPADLKPGTYQLQAKGTETATTEITVVAASAESTASQTMAAAPAQPCDRCFRALRYGARDLFGRAPYRCARNERGSGHRPHPMKQPVRAVSSGRRTSRTRPALRTVQPGRSSHPPQQ